MKQSILLASTAVISVFHSSGAQAAQAPSSQHPSTTGAARDDTAAIGEIIVTAQKRSERLSSVGLSITAATGAQLAQRGVRDVADLTKIEPSLQFSKSTFGTPVYTIRGVGYFEQSIAAPPAVSVYQDEVPYTYPVMTGGALLDVQRVELLKGPQGTLYGQNATGGAINFIANKPTDLFEAGINATYARFNAVNFNGHVSGPITDTVRSRLAAQMDRGGAWQRSNTRDDRLGDKRSWAARWLTDWTPGSTFKATLNLNVWQDRSDTQAAQLEGFYLLDPQFVSRAPANQHVPNPAYLANNTYPAPIAAVLNNPISPHNDRAADWVAGTHPRADERYLQSSLRLDWDPSPAFGVTSLTSFEHFTENNILDIAGVNALSDVTHIRGGVNSFFQELRAHGNVADGKAEWIVGLNYSHDASHEYGRQDLTLSAGYLTATGIPWHDVNLRTFDTTETKSAFASGSFAVTNMLKLRAGVRYTSSDARISGCTDTNDLGLLRLATATVAPGECYTYLPDFSEGLYKTKLDQHNVPWRVGIDWQASRGTLFYVNVSKGYKAGSSPATGVTSYLGLVPVVQESLQSEEVGVKSQLLGGRVSITAAAFHYDYRNKQLLGRLLDPTFGSLPALVNIPKSKENGAEASLTFRPARGWTLDAQVTYLDSKVTSDFHNFDPYGNSINFKGSAFPFTPKWSTSGGIRYEWPVGSDLTAFVGAHGSYQAKTYSAFGSQFGSATDAPSLSNKAYALLDLSAGLSSANGHWQIEIWGRNVTNTYYWTTANYVFDDTIRYTGKPATYGVSVGYHF